MFVKGNSSDDLIAFFSTPEKPVKVVEWFEFWFSLTEEEKHYYRSAKLTMNDKAPTAA